MKKRVSWEGGYVIVRSGTVTDELNAQIISGNLIDAVPDGNLKGFWQHFGVLCSQTETSAGLPFKPELVKSMQLLDMQRAYEAYLRVPTPIQKKWTSALNAVNNGSDVIIEDVDEESPKP